MKQILLLFSFLILFSPCSLSAKNKILDSLETELKTAAIDTLKTRLLNKISIELSNTGEFEKALEKGQEALKIAKLSNDTIGMADSYNNIANMFLRLGKYDKALENFLLAIKNYEKFNSQKGIANCKVGVGVIYYYQKDYDKAIAYYSQAIVLYKSVGAKKGMSGCYNNVGEIYRLQQKFPLALECYKEALKISEETKNRKGEATALGNLGNVYYDLKNFKKALEYYLKSIEIKKEIGNKQGLALTLNNIASIYKSQKKFDEALNYSTQSLVLARSIDSKEDIKQAYLNLSEIYALKGAHKQAYDYYHLYNNIKDSIVQTQSNEQIHEMQTKYETELKDNEIALLNKNQEVQEAELKKKSIIIWAGLMGLLLILLLSVFIYRNYRNKKKANELLASKNKEIELQKSLLEEKNKDITDSIKYAQRIQEAILPPDETLNSILPEHFILYKPKDIVSGDFYWAEQWGKHTLIAAVDCTGHGVPGAFMSIVAANLLNEAVVEHALTQPAAILNSVRKGLGKILKKKQDESQIKDGMDAALISLNMEEQTLQFAGAYNPMWLIRNGSCVEYKADKTPIGVGLHDQDKPFTNHIVPLQKNDCIYIFTDGYADQFGGEKGKKFKYNGLKQLLLSNAHLPMKTQQEILLSAIEKWKGNLEQVDDILVLGIRIG